MLQPKKNKSSWEEEKDFLQNWYADRILPDNKLNKAYQKEKSQYVNQANKLPDPNFTDKIDDENTQGIYDIEKGTIDLLDEAGPFVYNHEGTHAINYPIAGNKSMTNSFSAIDENILPVDKIDNQWIKDNYSSFGNQEIMARLNAYRQLHNLKPDQEITPELIKSNRDAYNTGKIEFEDNTDQLYKLFEDEGLSNVLNKVVINDTENDTTIAAYGTGKMGTKMKKKKYALGTSGIEDPSTTIAKNNIMIAQAEQKAQSNPWIPITMMAGQLASSAISSYAGKGKTNVTPQVTSVNSLQPAGVVQNYGQEQFINAMGNSNASGNVEVEGKEVIELPEGQVAEVKGASHEKGGVDLNLPEGTKIYSKRIEKFGETMAERKKVRERKKLNLDKLLEDGGKNDLAVRNAHQRTMETLQAQEEEDLKTQELFGVMAAIQEFAYGTNEDGTPRYALGSPGLPRPLAPELDEIIMPITGTGLPRPTPAIDYPSIINNYDSYSPELLPNQPNNNNSSSLSLADLEANNPTPAAEIDAPGTVFSRTGQAVGDAIGKVGIKVPGTGDLVGIFGDLISTFGPMKNTLANRAGDTPNINAFEDFGKDALESNMSAMELAAGIKDSNLRRITAQGNAAKKSGRNSARGINQQRALDLATDINVNDASLNATDSYSRTMMDLFGQQAGLENAQDSAVMQGEYQRDLADRQDKDNFSTQLGKDISTQGRGIQQIGKDLNAVKQNEMMMKVINQLSKYGLAFDAQGNLIQQPQTI